ncbi:MAG TPA: cytochrome b [Micavibrio sp.]
MTTWRNTALKFGVVHKALHWIIAVLVIAMICVGLYMVSLDPSPKLFRIYALHKSVGISILTLAVLRLAWRMSNIRPMPLPNHQAWEKFLATIIHALLYAALFIMPLSGWIMSSAKGFSVSVFGLFTLPNLVRPDKSLADLAITVHSYTAWTLIAMIALHAAGALKHHLIDRDDTLRRMFPGATLRNVEKL